MSQIRSKGEPPPGTAGNGYPDWNKPGQVQHILVELIDVAEDNPRKKTGNPKSFKRFKASVQKYGILQPLIGKPSKNRNRVKLESGHRRRLAAVELKLKTVPMLLVKKEDSKSESRARILAHNFYEPLPPLEQADLIRDEMADTGSTVEDVCEDWNVDLDETKLCIAMLESLHESVQGEVNHRSIPIEIGYLISRVADKEVQQKLARLYLTGSLSKQGLNAKVREALGAQVGLGAKRPKGIRSKSPPSSDSSTRGAKADNGDKEYVFTVPANVCRMGATVRITCPIGMPAESQRKALEHVLQHNFSSDDD